MRKCINLDEKSTANFIGTIRFSRKITSQLQNWAFLTYLHGKPRNTYIYPMQERQNVSNTSRHQEVVVSLLNLHCYSCFSCLGQFERSYWIIDYRRCAIILLEKRTVDTNNFDISRSSGNKDVHCQLVMQVHLYRYKLFISICYYLYRYVEAR